jgi:hypothetical protein
VSITINEDYKDLLSAFNAESVEYLIVGAFAVAAYGRPRYTKDFDVWVRPVPENAERVYRALVRFGAPMRNMQPSHFTDENLVFQIGVEPIRIDIVTAIDGVEFDAAWCQKVRFNYGGAPTWVIGRQDLIKNKRAAGRPRDIEDVEALEKIGEL